jgi:hypothetical protein
MKKKFGMYVAAAVGLCAFAAIASAYNGDEQCGSYENPCICAEVDEDGTCIGGPQGG